MRNRPERVLYRIERDGHRHVLRALHFEAMPLESPLKNSVNDLNSSDLVVFLFLLLAAIAADAVQHK